MELNFPKIKIESSDNFKTKSFGFGDKRVIINILRSKMYSDPIYTVCQEIMSNSRDAHREAGKEATPTRVTLPSRFNETIKFQDFGPGISPDRMENVFVLYGQSTKRGDNLQTGGFGLGAKTPFSYTDSFNIITITDDVDGRHKREYVAYIDESQIGAMSLLNTSDTAAHTGTTIDIPVKRADFVRFEETVLKVGRFWKVRPEVKGGNKKWTEETIDFKGTNWHLSSSDTNGRFAHGYRYSRNSGKPIIIIDGIQYPLKVDTIDAKLSSNAKKISTRNIRLFFATGELKVTANREDLDYQPDVIDKICKRIDSAFKELVKEVSKSIINAKTLREAIKLWAPHANSYAKLVATPKWNNLNLTHTWTPSYYDKDIHVFHYEVDRTGTGIEVITKRRSRYQSCAINVRDNVLLVEHDDDTERPHIQKIKKLFNTHTSVEYITCVKVRTSKASALIETNINWSHLGVEKLSVTDKEKMVRKNKASSIIHVKRLTSRKSERCGIIYNWESASDISVTAGGVFVTIWCGDSYLNIKKDKAYDSAIAAITKESGLTVYGVLSRAAEKLGSNWTSLGDKCDEIIANLEADKEVKDYLSRGEAYSLANYVEKDDWKTLLKHKNSFNKSTTMWKFIDESSKAAVGVKKVKKMHTMQSLCKKNRTVVDDSKMKKLQDDFKKEYPLVDELLKGDFNNSDIIMSEIINYVNMKDGNV